MREYTLYILKCSNGSLYTGITNNLEKRMRMHEAGKGSKYVRAHLPFQVIYTEEFKNKSEALKREYFIKNLSRKEKMLLIAVKNSN